MQALTASDPGETGDAPARVAVVIATFEQPGLLSEALESVLDQRAPFGVVAVIVDGGRPLAQTRDLGVAYARAFPGRAFYLRRPHEGLSAARNAGVEFVLRHFAQCEAIGFLDGDNALHPDFLARAFEQLSAAAAEIGWVYPDLDMFGLAGNYALGGDYSLFMQIYENHGEAGGLVRRAVFESGVRFDETMRSGFEDWDFWLQSAALGFRGRHLPHAGFRYRRRAQMSLAASERPALIANLRHKHRHWTRPPALLRLEHEEAPRFALYMTERDAVEFFTDPARADHREQTRAASRLAFLAAQARPAAAHFPAFIGFASGPALDRLSAFGLIRNVFWQAQRLLQNHPWVAVVFAATRQARISLSLSEPPIEPAEWMAAPLLFAQRQAMATSSGREPSSWLATLAAASVARITVELPAETADLAPALNFVVDEARELADADAGRSPLKAEWRADARTRREQTAKVYDELYGARNLPPHVAEPGEIHIGLIRPQFAFGAVERVVFNYARALKRRGLTPHLFITGANESAFEPEFAEVFASVHFFGPDENAEGRERSHRANDLVGLLATMNAVLNADPLGAQAAMAALRRLGVKTYLHLVESTPCDFPHAEPAYDGVVVASERLRDGCVGHAVPSEKLFLIRNAPSYPVEPEATAALLAGKRQRLDEPLRAAFLGRLDVQEGLDRLTSIIRQTRAVVEWRVIGASAGADFEDLGVKIEPPARWPEELDQVYDWADAVVTPSRFEGAPLTILEAQRAGCVTLTVDDGAIGEIVAQGVDGLIISADSSEARIVSAFSEALLNLAANRERALEIGRRASERAAALDGDAAAADWIAALMSSLALEPRP